MKSIQLILRGIKKVAPLHSSRGVLFSGKDSKPDKPIEPASQSDNKTQPTKEASPVPNNDKISQWKMSAKQQLKSEKEREKKNSRKANQANGQETKKMSQIDKAAANNELTKGPKNKTSDNTNFKPKSPFKQQVEQSKAQNQDKPSDKQPPSDAQNMPRIEKRPESLKDWKKMQPQQRQNRSQSNRSDRDSSLVKNTGKVKFSKPEYDGKANRMRGRSAPAPKESVSRINVSKKKILFKLRREKFVIKAAKDFGKANSVLLKMRKQLKKLKTEEAPRKSFFDHLKDSREFAETLTEEQAVSSLKELIGRIKSLDLTDAPSKLHSLNQAARNGLALSLGAEIRTGIKELVDLPQATPEQFAFRREFFSVVNALIANSKSERFIPEILNKELIDVDMFLKSQVKFTAHFARYVEAFGHTVPGYCIKVLDHFLNVNLEAAAAKNMSVALKHLTSILVNMRFERIAGHEKQIAEFLKIIKRTIQDPKPEIKNAYKSIPMETVVISSLYLNSRPSFKENSLYEIDADSLILLADYHKRLDPKKAHHFERVLMAFVEDKTFHDHIHYSNPSSIESFNIGTRNVYSQVQNFLKVFSDRFVQSLAKVKVDRSVLSSESLKAYTDLISPGQNRLLQYFMDPLIRRKISDAELNKYKEESESKNPVSPLLQKIIFNKILSHLRADPSRESALKLEVNGSFYRMLNETDQRIMRILLSGLVKSKSAPLFYSEYLINDMARHIVAFKLKVYMKHLAQKHDNGIYDLKKLDNFINNLKVYELIPMLKHQSLEHDTLEYIEFLGGYIFTKMTRMPKREMGVMRFVEELNNATKENRPILFKNVYDPKWDAEEAQRYFFIASNMNLGKRKNEAVENLEEKQNKEKAATEALVEIAKEYNKKIDEMQPQNEKELASCFNGILGQIIDKVPLPISEPYAENSPEMVQMERTIKAFNKTNLEEMIRVYARHGDLKIASHIRSSSLYGKVENRAKFFRSHKFHRIQFSDDPDDTVELLRYVVFGKNLALAEKVAKFAFEFGLKSVKSKSLQFFQFANAEVEDPTLRAKLLAFKVRETINDKSQSLDSKAVLMAENMIQHPSYKIAMKHFKSQADVESIIYMNKQAKLYNSYQNLKHGF